MGADLDRSATLEAVIRPDFADRLRNFDLEALSEAAAVTYGVDERLRLAYLNPAWFLFASRNEGEPAIGRDWGLDRGVLDACPEAVRGFYADAYARTLGGEETWEHEYECSSAGIYRRFHQTVYPLVDRGGLLVVNALVVERPLAPTGDPDAPDAYRDADGIVVQCCHCRKVQHRTESERWDRVPAWVTHPPDGTSHGLCAVCLDHYYPE